MNGTKDTALPIFAPAPRDGVHPRPADSVPAPVGVVAVGTKLPWPLWVSSVFSVMNDAYAVGKKTFLPFFVFFVTFVVPAVSAGAEPFPKLNWALYRPLRNVQAVFCHVTDPAVAFLATSDGLYRTDDEGKTWKAVEAASAEKIGVVTTLAVSPANGKVILVGTDDKGLHLSADGGTTWKKLDG